jgi:flagellar hook assembly protein FlgD
VRVGVYDVTGKRVRLLDHGTRDPGTHALSWDGRDHAGRAVAGGVYFYRLEGAGPLTARRMLLIR